MNRVLLILSLVAVVLFVSACIKPVILIPTGDDAKYSATKIDTITFSTTAQTEKSFKEVGYVFAQGDSWKNALKLAKEKTAAQGGEAIINGRGSVSVVLAGVILFFPVYETYYFVEGTVIRYDHP
jgi:hypothetical protein